MAKIIRTPTRVTGGITAAEKRRMDEHAQLWIERAFRTTPIEPDKIVPAIEGLYAAAGLKKPRVVIVPSPLVMAFAYGASSAVWYRRNGKQATGAATGAATYAATAAATYAATYDATAAAAYDDTGAAEACLEHAGLFGLQCAQRWAVNYQGGNMWAGYDCYLTAFRDVLGLQLREHPAYACWEQAAIHSGFRVLHPEFCMVSDFPETIRVDDQNRPHCETGPSHRWRDGWSLYHIHGVRVPASWIEDRANLKPEAVLKCPNLEQRRVGIELLGWDCILAALPSRIIDQDADPHVGTLIEVELPDIGKAQFLRCKCGTGRQFALGVDPAAGAKTALDAQAWLQGLSAEDFRIPQART